MGIRSAEARRGLGWRRILARGRRGGLGLDIEDGFGAGDGAGLGAEDLVGGFGLLVIDPPLSSKERRLSWGDAGGGFVFAGRGASAGDCSKHEGEECPQGDQGDEAGMRFHSNTGAVSILRLPSLFSTNHLGESMSHCVPVMKHVVWRVIATERDTILFYSHIPTVLDEEPEGSTFTAV